MRYNKIRKMDIADGPGIRVSIFMQGCNFNCKNCFNPETHDFAGGKEFTQETIDRVLKLADNEMIEGLSILGGEPMHPKNIDGTTLLAKQFKEKYPTKTIWAWTGFTINEEWKEKEVLKEQAINEGKPQEIAEKMVEGRVKKFYKEICLEEQPFVKDVNIDVKTFVKNNGGTIKAMYRFEVGEGMEKREENFAEEVMKQMK